MDQGHICTPSPGQVIVTTVNDLPVTSGDSSTDGLLAVSKLKSN